ncbi:integrase catalytic domain-containing protein [Trichonephila clavipes]|nr:integrase catalytic domain-containing protein [Trichonephila clavipes]
MLNDEISSSLLVNKSFMKQVFLQTLVVCINVNKSDYYVRVLIDSGSVKSYLSKFLSVTLNLECTGEDTIIHGLFGGIEKGKIPKKYRVNVNNIDKSFSFDLDVMDQEKICVSIPKISNPKIINKIKNSGILASDICFNENMCLYENDPNEIHMLIGADFAGRLLTGEIKQITENLVAIHTRLGWTLMGESGENTRRCETLLSLHVSDLDISELWRLDTIGIKDLGENQSKRELEEAAKLHFLENVKGIMKADTCIWDIFKPIPFRATIEFHLKNAPDHYKETAHTLLESFYVDNLVCSVNSKEKLDKLIVESQEILEEERRSVPVLGLKWDLDQDLLSVDIKVHESKNEILTKRKILSLVHKIFDPIGYTCPVTLIPKIMLQECWTLKVKWDSELPASIWQKFQKWKDQLDRLKAIAVPRCMIEDPETSQNLSLHVFCDASKAAYATCIFLKSENENSASCQLVQARSRVAPLKSISIPRLELFACTIGARLARTVKEDLKLPSLPVFYWSDSTNALYWIKKSENWAVFVSNRVKEIRNLSNPDDWYYVPGSKNPADLPSRGCSVDVLAKSKWWEGPDWLRGPPKDWPIKEIYPDFEIVNAEKRKTVTSATNSETNKFKFFNDVSSFGKIVRIMAYVLRFCNNLKKNRIDPKKGKLEVAEHYEAEKVILKEIQLETLAEEKQIKLNTMKGDDGLIRVETRVSCRKDLETFRYPILLPNTHQLVKKLIMEKHIELEHAGTQTLMSNLRESYWIIKSRKTIRQVVRSCITCKRFSARPLETVSIPLPEDRVRDAAIFEVCGVDLCGPLFFLKENKKYWIVLFTCAIYRAVHLELITSLSTDSFILAFRRFIARRGRPTTIYSDNGKILSAHSTL